VLLSAHDPHDVEELRARGADHVLQPYEAAAANAVTSLTATLGRATRRCRDAESTVTGRTRAPPSQCRRVPRLRPRSAPHDQPASARSSLADAAVIRH
jgi:hypothetical protein